MQNQRGFIGVGVLIAIILAVVVLGGGAYYVIHQQSAASTLSDNTLDNSQTFPTNTTNSNQTPTQTTQTNTNTNAATTFSVPGSFTLTRGQTIKQTGVGTPVSIMYKDVVVADSKGPAEYCPALVLSNGIAPAQTVTICPDNPNYLPYLYQGLSIMLTNSSASSASFSVSATTQAPTATIDKSSLTSNSASPTLTGTATNLDKISIEIKTSTHVVSPDTAGNIGYIPVVNGHWSATFSTANLAAGTYAVTVYHPYNRSVLATGNLTVNLQANTSGLQTYTNSQYGFSSQYPSTMQIQTSGYQSSQFFDTSPVAYIALRNDTEQTEGYLTFNIGSVSKNSANCPNPGDAPGIYEMSINGQTFARREILGPGGGIQRNYTIRRGDVCYAMVATAFPSACVSSGCSNPKWSAQTETTLLNQFDTVIQSFRFVQ